MIGKKSLDKINIIDKSGKFNKKQKTKHVTLLMTKGF